MSSVTAAFATLRDRIDERNLRERILLLAAALVVLFLIWDIAIRAPVDQRADAAADRIAQIERDRENLRATERTLRTELEDTAGDDHQDRATALRAEIEAIDERLATRTARVISPAEMVAVLRDMVAADDALTLEALANLGADEVIAEDRDEGIPRVYRHRVEVVASGDFFALLAYLQRLEGLDWQFQWDELRLETTSYPRARITISLSTLSLEEGWIGV